MSPTAIRGLERVAFSAVGVLERADLQRLLRDHIEVIAPETLVILKSSLAGTAAIAVSIYSRSIGRHDWSSSS
jgi:hypothetical protein